MPTVKGRAETSAFLRNIPGQLTRVIRGAARAGGNVIADEIKDRTPSDEVRDNVRLKTRTRDKQVTVKIDIKPGWGRSLGTWLEYGTSPHFISVDEAQRKGRSVGRINQQLSENDGAASLVIGGNFVGSTVWHPGARPFPVFRPALDTKERAALAEAQAYINNRVRRSGIVVTGEGDDE